LTVSVYPDLRAGSTTKWSFAIYTGCRTKDLNDTIMIDEIIEEVKKQGGSLD
jgi:hypothetical protein